MQGLVLGKEGREQRAATGSPCGQYDAGVALLHGVRACSGRRSKRQSFLGGELSVGAISAGQAHRCWGNTVKVQSLGGSPAEECSIKAMSPA